MQSHLYSLLLLFLLPGCQESEELSGAALKRQNQHGEFISRKAGEENFTPPAPIKQTLPTYPWDSHAVAGLPTITKDFFRCKGSPLNPEKKVIEGENVKRYYDCGGNSKHGLPLKDGEEFIYPILIDLLNEIQGKVKKRVVITSGHRCPTHNSYVDNSRENLYSKHQIGAEVSFYVEGMESSPEAVIQLIQEHYSKEEESAYQTFVRYEKPDTNVRIPPWYNKEIFIKLFQSDEGRGGDNRHPYPYISIQVRYDRLESKRVSYDWDQAYRGYLRR